MAAIRKSWTEVSGAPLYPKLGIDTLRHFPVGFIIHFGHIQLKISRGIFNVLHGCGRPSIHVSVNDIAEHSQNTPHDNNNEKEEESFHVMFLFGKRNLEFRIRRGTLTILTMTTFKTIRAPASGMWFSGFNLLDAFPPIRAKGIFARRLARNAGFGIRRFALRDLKGTRLGDRRAVALVLTDGAILEPRAQSCAFGSIKASEDAIRTCLIRKGTIGTGKAKITDAFAVVRTRSVGCAI
jgi:hypothetical protein